MSYSFASQWARQHIAWSSRANEGGGGGESQHPGTLLRCIPKQQRLTHFWETECGRDLTWCFVQYNGIIIREEKRYRHTHAYADRIDTLLSAIVLHLIRTSGNSFWWTTAVGQPHHSTGVYLPQSSRPTCPLGAFSLRAGFEGGMQQQQQQRRRTCSSASSTDINTNDTRLVVVSGIPNI